MAKEQEKEQLYIPKSDVQAGPGLVPLDEALIEQQNPLQAFNVED
ncbi:hypothetical protein V6C27_11315 [Peptococcaceae bacterium 1198_IL3148]